MEMMEPTQTGEVRQDERWWAAGAHAGALLLAFLTSWMAGVAGMVAGLVVYLLMRDRSA